MKPIIIHLAGNVPKSGGNTGIMLEKLNGKLQLVLASKSGGRAKVLRDAGFVFDVVPSDVDESAIRDLHLGMQSLKILSFYSRLLNFLKVQNSKNFHDRNPESLVKKLALAKAEYVAAKLYAKNIVIGADTVCVFGGKIIEKPRDLEEAAAMLGAFSGKTHMILTGIAVVNKESKKSLVDVSVSTVTFRKIREAEIGDYLKSGDALRFAGGYNIDSTKSMRFIEGISGSYTGTIGMPLEKLIPMLKKCGVDA